MMAPLLLFLSVTTAQVDPPDFLPNVPDGVTNNGSAKGNGCSPSEAEKKEEKNKDNNENEGGFFFCRLLRAYKQEFTKKDNGNGDEEEQPRRAMPSPWSSPPFPGSEYQGYPLIGVPASTTVYPLMKAIYGGPWGEEIKDSRITAYGWVNASGNWSTAKNSNTPDSYWIVPNRYELDQFVFRLERLPDTVQTDRMDWGFRATALYGIDYRYMTSVRRGVTGNGIELASIRHMFRQKGMALPNPIHLISTENPNCCNKNQHEHFQAESRSESHPPIVPDSLAKRQARVNSIAVETVGM